MIKAIMMVIRAAVTQDVTISYSNKQMREGGW
jgi:hypothetical protein